MGMGGGTFSGVISCAVSGKRRNEIRAATDRTRQDEAQTDAAWDWTHARASIAASAFKIIRLSLCLSLSLSHFALALHMLMPIGILMTVIAFKWI